MERWRPNGKKWIVFSVIALCCAVAVLIASFLIINRLRENYARYSPDQVTGQILSTLKMSDLTKVDPDQVAKHYDIPSGTVADSSLYISKSPESASELACFLLTDSSKYSQVETAITTHISTKAAGFKSLNPTQYNALKNVVISHSGRYVLVAVGNNAASAEKLFLDLLGEKSS